MAGLQIVSRGVALDANGYRDGRWRVASLVGGMLSQEADGVETLADAVEACRRIAAEDAEIVSRYGNVIGAGGQS